MTTLNTIIEEEKDEVTKQLDITLPPCDEVITGGHFLDVQKAIHTLITSAIQRAYEAGREERDTYWKERVRKEVEEMAGKTVWNVEGKPHISAPDLLQALDNLK